MNWPTTRPSAEASCQKRRLSRISEGRAAGPVRWRWATAGLRSRAGIFSSRLVSSLGGRRYRTNLIPTDLPRRQTTSQLRPVRASRENASFSLAGSVLGSSIVTLAPLEDMSCTTHGRAAKPPSSVIHPD